VSVPADLRACPGCGLELPELDAPTPANVGASAACWALYGRLLVYEYSQAPSARHHRLTVDTYAVQHPGRPEHGSNRSQALHLIGLCLLLEQRASARQTTKLLAQVLEHRPSFRWLEPPVPNGTITVSDVVAPRNPDDHARRIEQWASRVWSSWAPHHASVRGWIEGCTTRAPARGLDVTGGRVLR
jgi:Family of unknown function (DUF5946)